MAWACTRYEPASTSSTTTSSRTLSLVTIRGCPPAVGSRRSATRCEAAAGKPWIRNTTRSRAQSAIGSARSPITIVARGRRPPRRLPFTDPQLALRRQLRATFDPERALGVGGRARLVRPGRLAIPQANANDPPPRVIHDASHRHLSRHRQTPSPRTAPTPSPADFDLGLHQLSTDDFDPVLAERQRRRQPHASGHVRTRLHGRHRPAPCHAIYGCRRRGLLPNPDQTSWLRLAVAVGDGQLDGSPGLMATGSSSSVGEANSRDKYTWPKCSTWASAFTRTCSRDG